jgi:glutamate-1-semialdehyde 2,1-aminomutase
MAFRHSLRRAAPLARLLQDAIPCAERLLFCNSGSEATGYAMRAARAFTGKEKIGIFDGYWQGMHDYCMVAPSAVESRERPSGVEISTGIPKGIRDLIVPLPYRNPSAFDIIRDNKNELAMVIIEPVQHSNPQREAGEYLKSLQEVCRECDVLFALDEMVTGFCLAYGGGQEYFGVTPDFATLGKACGGGLPIGVIAGREDFMRMFLPKPGEQGVFTGGTFTGNPLSMAAGTAAVRYYSEHPEIYAHMAAQGDRLTASFNDFATRRNMAVQMSNVGSMFHIYFQSAPVRSSFDIDEKPLERARQAFLMHTLNLGVLISGANRYYLSAAHSSEVVDRMIDVFQESLALVREDGLF